VAKHSFNTLVRRLAAAGFSKSFVTTAILPDWWESGCATDPALLPDFEIRVARFLGQSVAAIRDASAVLAAPAYAHAQLRRVGNIDADRLKPAIHAALAVASAVVRNLKPTCPAPALLPQDALQWRQAILGPNAKAMTLEILLAALNRRGIPIIPLLTSPEPKFQGLACVVSGRPVIVLGHHIADPGRVAFIVSHESGHIANGDCDEAAPVVDADDETKDTSSIERRADLYAIRILTGRDEVPRLDASDFRTLAERAFRIESDHGVDAGVAIANWARRTKNYQAAAMALHALYRGQGARRLLSKNFANLVDVENASESDRILLRCSLGGDNDDGGGEQDGIAA
jgi:Zn-dependent peptidase ImmA (M78 family)